MVQSLISIILIVFFSLSPILLWAYGSTYLSHHIWNRARFFAGGLGGVISIMCILFFQTGLRETGWDQVGAIIGVFFVLGVINWIIMVYGSPFIRGFLRRALLLHIFLFSFIILLWGLIEYYITSPAITFAFLIGFSGAFVAAYLEEGVKHLSSLGLTAKDFRFSRTDLLLFTFFITLGFVVGENLLYFQEAYKSGPIQVLTTGIYRLLFALPLHVFAASVCVMFWWKALSYRFLSLRYIVFFLSGFMIATLIHTLYNQLIQGDHFLLLMGSSLLSYGLFTQWLIQDTNKMEQATGS